MSSSAIDTTVAVNTDIAGLTKQRRRLYPQNPTVPGITEVRDSSAATNIARIASDIVTLNAFTLRALQAGWYEQPQIIHRGRHEAFLEFLTTNEKDHVDMLYEFSDHQFDDYITKYVETLSYAEHLSRIEDPRPAGYYVDLVAVCIKRYRAAMVHLASKATDLVIPKSYDYCETYQEYVEQASVQEIERRHELSAALRRASSLLESIRIAVDGGNLSGTTLSTLKTKLMALQHHYLEACSMVIDSPKNLFDPNTERWWEYCPAAVLVEQLEKPQILANVPTTLNFFVPAVCLLCCIPTGYAYFYSPPKTGTATDSDFWQLVAGSIMQLLSLVTLIWPGVMLGKLHRLSSVYIWLLAITSAASALASIMFHMFVSIRWSIIISFTGNAAQALILLQLLPGL